MPSIARKTLDRARFFNSQADSVSPDDREEYQHFIEAAIIFGRSVTFHLQKEFNKDDGFDEWYEEVRDRMKSSTLWRFMLEQRNYILKEGPLSVTRAITVQINETIVLSTRVEADVVYVRPWYRRSLGSIWGSFKEAIRRPIRKLTTAFERRERHELSNARSSSTISERLHFDSPEWRDRSATSVINEYLDMLEPIVSDAENRFTSDPP